MWTADDVGQSIVLLALVFLAAALIRKWSRHLRALFLPTAVIGGFLALALGPEGVGRLADSNGIFPDQTFAVWEAVPGLLINVMSASLLLGERLPTAPQNLGHCGPARDHGWDHVGRSVRCRGPRRVDAARARLRFQ
jgi:ESS family glutamate:Na+ symporter